MHLRVPRFKEFAPVHGFRCIDAITALSADYYSVDRSVGVALVRSIIHWFFRHRYTPQSTLIRRSSVIADCECSRRL